MDEFEWNVINERHLFQAMVGHKPIGVNKYFQMACIWDKFTESLNKDVQSEKIWTHLETMYNLEALDESESLPFPNDERDFCLPDSEYASLIAKKEDNKVEEKKNLQKGRETPKVVKEIKKEEKTPVRTTKDVQRRDSKDSKDGKTPTAAKKEIKKEPDNKNKPQAKSRNSLSTSKDEPKGGKTKSEDIPKAGKRPTRGSLKPEETPSSGKSSPVTVTPGGTKRRRI